MRQLQRKLWSLLTVAAVVALTAYPLEARVRARPGKSSTSAPRVRQHSTHHRGTTAAVRVRGRTSRHHHGRHAYGYYGHHAYYGHYGHYGHLYYRHPFFPYYSFWWGWPYAHVGWAYVPGASYGHDAALAHSDAGVVETDIRPGKSEVFVDGQPYGRARDYNGVWDYLLLAPGTHMLEFRAPRHQTLRVRVEVRPRGFVHLKERLVKGEGIDPRSSPDEPPPAVDVDGERRSATGAASRDAGAGALRRGRLRIEAHPPDAAVYLDGEFLARADELSRLHGALPVAEGWHTIEVVRPGYESETREIEVKADEPARAVLELSRKP